MAEQNSEELTLTCLGESASARTARIRSLVELLKVKAGSEGALAAQVLARRAVSPLLDYSSLLKLRRYLVTNEEPTATKPPLRLAILGGPTTIQLRQLVEVFLAGEGVAVEIYEGDYDLFRQEILNPHSPLDAFKPQIVFLATGANQVSRFPGVEMDSEAVARVAEEEFEDWATLWRTANSRWNATVLQNNFEIAPSGAMGHFALRHPAARENYLERLNGLMANRAPAWVILHDLRGLAAEAGAGWFDPRFHLEFKMPCSPDWLVLYAHSAVSLLRAALGRSKKVLVLDLDNTLWGGVVGDAGAGGIQVGQGSGQGEAFLAFQRYAKDLLRRGILLAVCSKNDENKAREPFEKRQDMILKLDDISCFLANWNNKADNIQTIAKRLELKLDSFVFVDDNPMERAVVRRFLPEVAVPELPDDPAGYIQAVSRHRYFETVAFTREDAARARYYTENVKRTELASQSVDLASFLQSLQMRMKVEPINELNSERVTQLINKSNQFNLVTNRYTIAQVRDLMDDPDCRALTFSLSDRLGDNGLISVVTLRKQQDTVSIVDWVMSCRVLQRGVENFTRNCLVDLARWEGCRVILGCYIPSPKNAMVKDHYASLGFDLVGRDGEVTRWSLRVDGPLQPLPHAIEEEYPQHAPDQRHPNVGSGRGTGRIAA